ncbi:hypothetical protein LOK49_LG03G02205 [Camellia lanceoleosa]|uniref:Uncharacterized protein n=1 Tax=Camellia lanceoleosa TaxID=1840588 RepID=A0ACC0IDP3_9ERIC|nr:hypothetical protein LOK49_LG03G02205 [Camellia lanceoleosa]
MGFGDRNIAIRALYGCFATDLRSAIECEVVGGERLGN